MTTNQPIKCPYCGSLPELVKGKHHQKEQFLFHYECKNWRCKLAPATADCRTASIALLKWNNKETTTNLFVNEKERMGEISGKPQVL
jgi:hypothetical protein